MLANNQNQNASTPAEKSVHPIPGKVYHIDFSRGKLVPVDEGGLLPVGQIVTYEDQANPRREFVVIGEKIEQYSTGQRCVCEDGHRSAVSKSAIDGPGGWRLGNRILNAEEIAAFEFNAEGERIRIERERKEKSEAKAKARQAERESLPLEYPSLEREGLVKYRGYVLAARNIRKLLAKAFPGTKFSVTSDSFSMGNSVDVRWTDGPSTAEVDAIGDKFQECDFDGMDDSTSYRNNVFTELFGGAKYVQTHRSITTAQYLKVAAEFGYPEVTIDEANWSWSCDYQTREMISRETWKRSF